jgi:prepilin-type N-terminal cleavage/methylation domain-containing protein
MGRECSRHGFTLLEMLVGLVITSLLFAFTGNLGTTLPSQQSQVTVSELRRLLTFARTNAVASGQRVTLCAIDSIGKCQQQWNQRLATVFIDANRNRRLDHGETLLSQESQQQRPGQLSWRAALGRPYIEFKPSGATHQNGSFHFCPDAQTNAVAIIVNRAGRHYVGGDRNNDGIREDSRGRNLRCPG